MDDHEDFLMGPGGADSVFDNFASGLDLDATSHSSNGEQAANDVFEDTIMLKTKKKSCKTYWL